MFTFNSTLANEPFVVLEYKGTFNNKDMSNIDSNNKFLKDNSYSTTHKIRFGESLGEIINKYYGKTGLNKTILEVSLIEINKHAFVRKNPNYMFAGKKIQIPSINQIMNLVKNKPTIKPQSNRGQNHIYFYGN